MPRLSRSCRKHTQFHPSLQATRLAQSTRLGLQFRFERFPAVTGLVYVKTAQMVFNQFNDVPYFPYLSTWLV